MKIVFADDYPLFREGILLMLRDMPEVKICGTAHNGISLLEVVKDTLPEIVITDIQMPLMDGIVFTQMIKQQQPSIKVIALTMFGDDDMIVDMIDAGADGYVLKSAKKEELYEAIKAVYEGGTYFCNSTSMRLTKMIARNKPGLFDKQQGVVFNEKEKEIIHLICQQYTSKQIADVTNLAHRTVEKYRDRIMEKTGAKNVVGIVIYAIQHGLFKP